VSCLATKAKLIVNPVAGADTAAALLPRVNERLRSALGDLDIVMTTGPGDARHAARAAVKAGYDHLFVIGGDGTLNEVVNGVASIDNGLATTTFGVVPLGTGNDFAGALGLPDDPLEAVEALLRGRTVQVDVGQINEHRFVNVSAGGFIAEVSDAVQPELKTIAGKLAYLIGGAKVLLNFSPIQVHLRVPSDGVRPLSEPMGDPMPEHAVIQAFAVCNARLIGGGRLIAPFAAFDDGLLDVCLLDEMAATEFVALLTRVATGDHVHDERVHYFRVTALDLTCERVIKVNTDGEVLETDVCRYRITPGAARFLCKPEHSGAARGV
jgi:diacylglycerol kinase (ATP)